MKLRFIAIAMLLIFTGSEISARKAELYASRYYVFQSNQQLNAHLYIYNKALACKFAKIGNDSLGRFSLRNKWENFSGPEQKLLNDLLIYYKDSLVSKDLLFDSLMRNFADYLSAENPKHRLKSGWQKSAFDKLTGFQPLFKTWFWPAIDSANRAWLSLNKAQITSMEQDVVQELEKIYKTKMPGEKIRVDLTCYATWAGAFSYNDTHSHVVFCSSAKANQGELAAEVIFHETSHFLVDKLMQQISVIAKSKKSEKELGLWHDMIFYTTGFVLEKYYKLKWQKFEPYYVQMKFPEKFPSFKTTVDGCKLYWDPYLNGQVNFDAALGNLVTYVLDRQ